MYRTRVSLESRRSDAHHMCSLNRKPRLIVGGVFSLDWDAVRALCRADVCWIRGDLRQMQMPGHEPRKIKFLNNNSVRLCTTESSRAPTDSNARARTTSVYILEVDTRGCFPRRARSPLSRADRRSPSRRAVHARDRRRDPSWSFPCCRTARARANVRRARCPSRAGTGRHPASAAG